MAELPEFIKDYVRKMFLEMRQGMRIRYIIPEAELIQMVLDQIELDKLED